ncbi:MAG: hypothetical protein Q4A28_04345 [Brachymonas sp.]|nr:hypothetical protein [Brachymonas sp.]
MKIAQRFFQVRLLRGCGRDPLRVFSFGVDEALEALAPFRRKGRFARHAACVSDSLRAAGASTAFGAAWNPF